MLTREEQRKHEDKITADVTAALIQVVESAGLSITKNAGIFNSSLAIKCEGEAVSAYVMMAGKSWQIRTPQINLGSYPNTKVFRSGSKSGIAYSMIPQAVRSIVRKSKEDRRQREESDKRDDKARRIADEV